MEVGGVLELPAQRSGRPRKLFGQIAEARKLSQRLHLGLEIGLDKLANAYPGLLELAIEIAMGKREGQEPDRVMLGKLIELLPRIVGEPGEDGEAPIGKLYQELRVNIEKIQINQIKGKVDGS